MGIIDTTKYTVFLRKREQVIKRDTVKTIVGLVVIAGVVVATFLYGNSQRQVLNRREQAKQSPSASPVVSSGPTSTPAVTNTKPTNTPEASQSSKPSSSSVSTTPVSGGHGTEAPVSTTGNDLPQAGSPLGAMVGLGAVGGMLLALRRSKNAILLASKARRT